MVDATGKWVLPGLMDAKANWNWQYGEAFLRWGVTSAMISGPRGDQGLAERDAINHGIYEGPRLFQTVIGIRGPRSDLSRADNFRLGDVNRVATSGAHAAELARTYRENGADFITFTDGNGEPEIFAQAIRETLDAGVAVVFRGMGPGTRAREVAELGDGIVCIHTCNAGAQMAVDEEKWATYVRLPPDAYSEMDDGKMQEMIALLLEANVYLEPDEIATGRGMSRSWARVQQEDRDVFDDPILRSYYPAVSIGELWDNVTSAETWNPPEQLAMRRLGFQNHARFLKAYVDAGGKIVAASDITQSGPGIGLHQEMMVFHEDIGLSPMQVIQSATKWVAEGFKQPDLGVIEEGKLADILIVNADPLQDLMNLRQVHIVIKDGVMQDLSYDASYQGHMFSVPGTDSDGPILGRAWAAAVKSSQFRPNVNSVRGEPGLPDSIPNFATSPTPGIEVMSVHTLIRGTPTTPLRLTGFNFVQRSLVYVDGEAVPTHVISRTEIEAQISENILARAGLKEIVVKNPEPVRSPIWGDTSNPVYLLVPFEFTTRWSQNRY